MLACRSRRWCDDRPSLYGSAYANSVSGVDASLIDAAGTLRAYKSAKIWSIVILTNTEGGDFDRYDLERSIARLIFNQGVVVHPIVSVPHDVANKVIGSYSIPGRPMLPGDPVTISVDEGQAFLAAGDRRYELNYLERGHFEFKASPDVSLMFPEGSGEAPFFGVYVYEMMLGRGMRQANTPLSRSGTRVSSSKVATLRL